MTRKFSDYNANDNHTLTLLLGRSLPEGLAWNSKADTDSNLYKLLSSLAEEIRALEDRIQRLAYQWDIRITTDLINEWETAVGIPDECRDKAADIVTRRADVIDKLRKVPVKTISDYVALAESITGETGWNIRAGVNGLEGINLPTSDPIGHWKMNGDSTDSSVNGNDGSDTAMAYSPGKINDAGDFDGADSKIDIGSAAIFDNIWDGGASISLLQNADSAGEGGVGEMIGKSKWLVRTDSSTQGLFAVAFSGTNGSWRFPLLISQWNHVVISYDSSNVTNIPVIYVNDTLVTVTVVSTPTGSFTSDTGDSLIIGNNTAQTVTFDGQLDDVRVYDSILPANNVAALYNSGNGTEDNAPSPETIALYRFILLVGSPSVASGAFTYPFGNNAPLSVTTLVSSGTTATATVSSTADMVNGSNVEISGATQTEYNGFYDITITSNTTFYYTFAGSGTPTATGTILVNFGADLPSSLQDASGNDVFIDDGVLFKGYPFAGSFRTDVLKCVFRKVTPANVVVVFD